jgi:hypothetical protein
MSLSSVSDAESILRGRPEPVRQNDVYAREHTLARALAARRITTAEYVDGMTALRPVREG